MALVLALIFDNYYWYLMSRYQIISLARNITIGWFCGISIFGICNISKATILYLTLHLTCINLLVLNKPFVGHRKLQWICRLFGFIGSFWFTLILLCSCSSITLLCSAIHLLDFIGFIGLEVWKINIKLHDFIWLERKTSMGSGSFHG